MNVKNSHTDNGIFAEAEFVRAVESDNQNVIHCAVSALHQNGKEEKKIRD